MAKNCPNLVKDMNINVQEVYWTREWNGLREPHQDQSQCWEGGQRSQQQEKAPHYVQRAGRVGSLLDGWFLMRWRLEAVDQCILIPKEKGCCATFCNCKLCSQVGKKGKHLSPQAEGERLSLEFFRWTWWEVRYSFEAWDETDVSRYMVILKTTLL